MNKLIISLLLLTLMGCDISTTKHPIIYYPPTPILESIPEADLSKLDVSTKEKLLRRDATLKNYVKKLIAGIDQYNTWATSQNKLK